MKYDNDFLELLENGEKCICFFVHEAICYWVVDYKYNFSLDAEKDYRGYLDKGYITAEQYAEACKVFRGGILKLGSENFLRYLRGVSEGVFSTDAAERVIEAVGDYSLRDLLLRVESHYLVGKNLSVDDSMMLKKLVPLLPLFYINFDRKIFMHMDADRFHEDLAHADWAAKCSDFLYLIPDTYRYWTKSGDLWKLRLSRLGVGLVLCFVCTAPGPTRSPFSDGDRSSRLQTYSSNQYSRRSNKQTAAFLLKPKTAHSAHPPDTSAPIPPHSSPDPSLPR